MVDFRDDFKRADEPTIKGIWIELPDDENIVEDIGIAMAVVNSLFPDATLDCEEPYCCDPDSVKLTLVPVWKVTITE